MARLAIVSARNVVALAFMGVLGCSAIAGAPPPAGLACTVQDGIDPCPQVYGDSRFMCSDLMGGEGVCRSIECTASEICGNGMDDDCNGEIDEVETDVLEECNDADDDCDGIVDEGLDRDMDGFTWCNTGNFVLDCDDNAAAVHPFSDTVAAPPEICDGIDNDCDPMTQDGAVDPDCGSDSETRECQGGSCRDVNCETRPGLCLPDTQFCRIEPSPPSCQPVDTSCFDPTFRCTAPERCDPTSGECVAPLPNGMACSGDAECESVLCVDLAALRLTAADLPAELGTGSGLCSTTCCSAADCGADETCWNSGSGTSACVPTSTLADMAGPPGVGACAHSDQCMQSECRGGVDSPFRLPDRFTYACRADGPDPDSCTAVCPRFGLCHRGTCQYQACSSNDDCATGICSSGSGGYCLDSCRSVSDCGSLENPFGSDLDSRCQYLRSTPRSDGRVDHLRVCVFHTEGDASANGASCANDNDCRDRACLDANGLTDGELRCAATCCSDTQCNAGEQCRPVPRSAWETRCFPRPVFGATASPT